MNDINYTNELYHHGVKGMRWGIRRAVRGHAGPGQYIGNKRKIKGYKNDLKYLDEGGHLSIGLTKKRQAQYDARDRRLLEEGISKAEQSSKVKKGLKVIGKTLGTVGLMGVTAVAGAGGALYVGYKFVDALTGGSLSRK